MHVVNPVVHPSLLPVVLSVAVAVIGWVTTHVLSLRAQKKSFQNQVLDRARLDVTSKLRDYQSWLSELSTWIRALSFTKSALVAGLTPKLREKADELLSLQSRINDIRAWSAALEDYQILFPETALARFRLDRRHVRIQMALDPVFSHLFRLSLGTPTVAEFDELIKVADSSLDLVGDQAALLDDLRVHLQNVALSQVMNRTIPVRNPPDTTVPRLAKNAAGLLEVVDATGKPLDEGGATPDAIAAVILAARGRQPLPPN